MKQSISDLQKRRADNIIWNCAKDYSFAPDFKAYDENGGVDLYWNIIFGSARRHYEYEKLEALFAMLKSIGTRSFMSPCSGTPWNRFCSARSWRIGLFWPRSGPSPRSSTFTLPIP